MLLENKAALVTGASRGIGRATALALAGAGARVAVNYAHSPDLAEAVVGEIEAAGGEAFAVGADVAEPAEVEAMARVVLDRFGRLDILVNNAGITRDNLVLRMKDEDWDAVVDTNLKGTFNTIRAFSRSMIRQRGGRIINVTSVVGLVGNPGQANYCAAKAGVIGLTRAMARELASRGITVNAVAPGFISTDMTGALAAGAREDLLQRIPLGRPGTPEDVAGAIVFLASEAASYITGHVLVVDGGLAM